MKLLRHHRVVKWLKYRVLWLLMALASKLVWRIRKGLLERLKLEI